MTDEITHDPRTKQKVFTRITEFIYKPVKESFDARLNEIVLANAKILSNGQAAFRYKGTPYYIKLPLPKPLCDLHESLHEKLENLLTDIEEVTEGEIPKVNSYLKDVLNYSSNFPDYLKLLPETVHAPIKDMIAECPCHTSGLNSDVVESIQNRNTLPIELMKRRMVRNLLL